MGWWLRFMRRGTKSWICLFTVPSTRNMNGKMQCSTQRHLFSSVREKDEHQMSHSILGKDAFGNSRALWVWDRLRVWSSCIYASIEKEANAREVSLKGPRGSRQRNNTEKSNDALLAWPCIWHEEYVFSSNSDSWMKPQVQLAVEVVYGHYAGHISARSIWGSGIRDAEQILVVVGRLWNANPTSWTAAC